MVIYNKDDKSLEIPNGLGNLSITINEGGGETPDLTNYATTSYVDEEILKVNSEIETINEDLDVLEGRVIDLENNTGGGGSSTDKPTHIITIYGGFQLSFTQISEIKQKFETHKVMVKSIGTQISIVEIINVVYNSSNSDYVAVYGISENKLYEWKFDTTNMFVNPTIIILGGGSSGGDTPGVDEEINNLQAQITANFTRINNVDTRINNVEQVNILDVSNGMSATQFNTIFNNLQYRNYKYLLNVGNNDLFEMCSIQTANRSITAIGFDDYEGEMMCYTWFAPQEASVPELTKRKIITEIV